MQKHYLQPVPYRDNSVIRLMLIASYKPLCFRNYWVDFLSSNGLWYPGIALCKQYIWIALGVNYDDISRSCQTKNVWNLYRKGMACKLMSNVNKVASFSRLRNEHIPSNTQQKGAWNSTPTPSWNWKTLRATGFGLGNREKHGPQPDSKRRPPWREACRLAYWAIRPSWPLRDKRLWLSIYSFCTCVKMFAQTLYTASENCWYLPKWLKVAKNECVSDRKYIEHYFDAQQNGDVWWYFFPGLRNFAFRFSPLVFIVVWKGPMKGRANHF